MATEECQACQLCNHLQGEKFIQNRVKGLLVHLALLACSSGEVLVGQEEAHLQVGVT